MLPVAIVAMTFALIFYSIGVWGEKLSGTIKGKHVAFFGAGFICDFSGTSVMKTLVNANDASLKTTIHTVTGAIALFLMLVHFVWAVYVWKKGSQKAKENFHKFSIVVWSFWLIPYVIGMIIGMMG